MLYLLLGMGANHEMYEKWNAIQGVKFINWSKYEGEISFPQIAEKIIEQNKITSKDWIGGSSLGGIIAIEVDKIINNKRVVLIGSATHIRDINPMLLKLSKLINVVPLKLMQNIASKVNFPVFQMFSQADTRFILFTSNHLSKWSGFKGDEDKIIRIHGNKDWIISHRRCKNIIKGAGHLIAMTHPSECEKALNMLFTKQNIQPI